MYRLSYEEVYYNRNESKIRDARLEFIKYVNKNGIKPASQRFNVRKNIIKKWVDRFNDQGIKGLRDQSKRPKNSPKQLNKSAIKEIRDVTLWAKHKQKVITAPNILTKVKNAQAHNVTTKCVNRYN